MKIKAAVCEELNGKIVVQDNIDLERPKGNEVLIEIVATGVCHTDLSGQNGTLPVPFPIVFGHEGAGIVKEVGDSVSHVEVGDHVVVAFPYCGQCEECLFGHQGNCEEAMRLNFGGFMEDGTSRLSRNGEVLHQFFGQSTFATYAVANEKNLVKVDKEVDLRYLGPLGCGFITGSATVMEGIRPKTGTSIVVLGCGGVGMSAIMGAKISGCSQIIAVDLNDERLSLAKELGATHTINSGKVNMKDELLRITNGKGVRYAVEATGVSFVAKEALEALSHAGEMYLIGAGYEPIMLDIGNELMLKVRTLKGMIEGETAHKIFIPRLIEFFKKGQFPIDKLIKFYSFDNVDEALIDMEEGKTIKPVLVMKS